MASQQTTSNYPEADKTCSQAASCEVRTQATSPTATLVTDTDSQRGPSVVASGAMSLGELHEHGVSLSEPLNIKMLMSSKDVGSIIGKGGMTIKAFRETSGARINISNSTSSERLVQISGSKENITLAFSEIGKKILSDSLCSDDTPRGGDNELLVSFKLVIQSSQCGSIIGKGGSRIKDIREGSGASIQVAAESLPNSTERAVTIAGSPPSLTRCIALICAIIEESPVRGPNIPYKPNSLPNQAYQPRSNVPMQAPYTATFHPGAGPATTSQQMRIPNDLIGCVIGRRGSKIHEIRASSGAQIKIGGNEGDSQDRLVTITGTPEAVGVAQYLINSRIHSEVNSFISVGMNL